jgi:hypothetical protein
MSDPWAGDHVYRIIIDFDVVDSTVDVSTGGLAPQLVRVALELAADYLAPICEWTITANHAGIVLVPAVIDLDEDDIDDE